MLSESPHGLPDAAEESFRRLLAFPLDTQERMISALDRYLDSVRRATENYPLVNVPLAESITAQLKLLLAYDPQRTPELHQKWIQAAARYFFLSDDATSDWDADGFHDDAEVVAAVAEAVSPPEQEEEYR